VAAVDPQGDVLDTPSAGPLVIRGGVLRGLGYVGSTLLALVGMALVTRHLGVANFGRFQTVISLITVVGTVTDAGMATLGLREYSQVRDTERGALVGSLLGLRITLTLTGAAIAAGIAAVLGYDSDLVMGAVLAGLGLALTVLQTTLTIPLAVELRNLPVASLDVLRQLLTTVIYAALVVAGAGVVAFLAVTIPVGVVLVPVAAVLVRGRISRPQIDLPGWGRLLRAAAVFSLAIAVGTIYLYTAQILVAGVTDARETGLFAASFRTFIVVGAIPGLLITVAFPLLSRAARDDRERLSYAVQRLLDTSVVLGVGACVALVVGAPAIIAIMAGSHFADAAPALRVQGVTLLATFVLAPTGFALLSLHLHRAILLANAAALTVMLPSVGLLASAWGATGAAAGTVLGETTLAAGYLIALRSQAPQIMPRPGRGVRAVPAALPALAALALPLPSWVQAVLALAVYVVMLALLRAIPEELRELVRRGRS
jgi:O-antigen/teichoic acid export membrane protein